jgi:thiol-disulfide isomerase/thioredoxin
VRRVLTALVACLLLTSCTTATPTSSTDAVAQHTVDVDTPALRALRARAAIEACVPGTASNDLPEVTLPCLGGGKAVDLSRLRGPMVVNLFAQWCGPCRTELPYYQRLHENARGAVRVLGVDYLDVQPASALQLAQRAGVTYPLLADPSGTLRRGLKVRGLPVVALVAKDGTVVDVQPRLVSSYAELRTLVRDKLGVTLPA